MRRIPGLYIPAFLVAQMLIVHWAAGNERAPAPPDLARFPVELAGWKEYHDDPIEARVASELGADLYVNRDYAQASSGTAANLFLAWYRSQRGGEKQPHSPKVCLPAAGWVLVASHELALDTSAGPIRVNRDLIQNGAARGVVLYWYQTPRRAIAGEWNAKLWLVADALRDRRTDVALIRIFVRSAAGGDEAATTEASSLARSFYPVLRHYLPE
ncbi:MAG TPA: EpsI family protein [Bryobacteraceae bacterium]|nr:EpsI family protein [Bryobacteraceae bacterium]